MSFQYKLQKILEVRDHEKQKAEKDFTDATKMFEEVATKLYEALKKKEDYEAHYSKRIEEGVPIFEIQQSQTLISTLQNQINKLQYYTQKARDNMNKKQESLVEKTIEVKKFEKMKELKYEVYIEDIKRQENMLMDEISVQQFMKR